MNNTPIFSVVMPMYNVEKYLRQSIDSVLAQSYSNFELICVNDGATDNTLEIAKSYSDTRIRIIHQKNQGLAAARNTGIRNAKGLYIALLDSDDFWHKHKLLSHLQHFCSDSTLDVSYSASIFVDENGNDMGIGQHPKLENITPAHILCRNPIGNGSAPVIKRSLLTQISEQRSTDSGQRTVYFDETMRQSEDIELWIRLALQTQCKFGGIGKPLTYYRVNSSGLSANLQKQYSAWQFAIDKNRPLSPVFFNRWYKRAAAYQKRYLARRAVQSREAVTAIKLSFSALFTDWRILREEPSKSILTIGCALLSLLPQWLYNPVERFAMKFINKRPVNV